MGGISSFLEGIIEQGACIACRRRICGFLPRVGQQKHYELVTLERGQRLETCREGCLKFWIVVSGTAAICTSFRDGRRQITGIEMPGDTICALIATPDQPSWLEALEECRICVLDFSSEAATLHRDPEFLAEMFRVIHQRLEIASRHLSTLGRLDSTERVLLFLGQMALRNRQSQAANDPVRLKMSREDIADYLGLNAETVSRILSRVKKSGLVKFLSPTEYLVPDMAAIARRVPVPIEPGGNDPMAATNGPGGEMRGVGA